jgi:uncharacterized membrane protein
MYFTKTVQFGYARSQGGGMRRIIIGFLSLLSIVVIQLVGICEVDSIEQAVVISNCDCQSSVEDEIRMGVDACSMSDCISSILLNAGIHMAPIAWYEYNEIFAAKEDPEDYEDCITRTLQGDPIYEKIWDGALQEVDIRCDSWFEHVWDGIEPVLAASFAAWQDNISSPAFLNGGISTTALTAFPSWLSTTYTPQELSNIGIEELQSFDITSYLQTNELDKGNLAAPENPIFRALLTYEYETNLNTWRLVQDRARGLENEIGHDVNLFGNQGMMWMQNASFPYAALLSQYNPIIQIEHVVYTDPLPPYSHSSLVAKIGRASAIEGQPVWICGIIYDWEREETYFSRDLARLIVSEGYANGARRIIELVMGTPHGDIPVPSDIRSGLVDLGRWIQRYDLYETAGETLANVALVYSVPTLMWRFYPPTGHWNWPQTYEFSGWSQIMEEEHIPYDVVMFGHPSFWDDSDLAGVLSAYDVLILPRVDCISDAQLEALDDFTAQGGTVIVSGEFATRTEDFVGRTNTAERALQVVAYEPLDATDYYSGRLRRTVLLEERTALASFLNSVMSDKRKLVTDVGSDVAINLLRGADGNLQIHLLNYDYDPVLRESISHSQFSISLQADAEELAGVSSVFLFTPDTADGMELAYEIDGDWISVNVPEIDIYSVLVIGGFNLEAHVRARQHEILALVPETAQGVFADNFAAIQALINLGDWRNALIGCEDLLTAYYLLPPEPIAIAVDQGHENQTSLTFARSRQMSSQYPEWYHLALLEEHEASELEFPITREKLTDLDVIVVPASWEEFGANEIEAIQSFVHSGGGLLLLGTCFVTSGDQNLLEAFGIQRMDASLGAQDSTGSPTGFIAQSVEDHWITEQVSAVWPRAAAQLVLNEDWTVLMATGSDTYADRNDSEMHDPGEPDGPFPFLAVRSHGRGRVAAVADHTLFGTASTTEGQAIADRIILWLAGRDS